MSNAFLVDRIQWNHSCVVLTVIQLLRFAKVMVSVFAIPISLKLLAPFLSTKYLLFLLYVGSLTFFGMLFSNSMDLLMGHGNNEVDIKGEWCSVCNGELKSATTPLACVPLPLMGKWGLHSRIRNIRVFQSFDNHFHLLQSRNQPQIGRNHLVLSFKSTCKLRPQLTVII